MRQMQRAFKFFVFATVAMAAVLLVTGRAKAQLPLIGPGGVDVSRDPMAPVPFIPAPFWVEVEWNNGNDAIGRRVQFVGKNEANTQYEFSETHPDGSEAWALLSRNTPTSTEWFVRAYLIGGNGSSWTMTSKVWVPGNSAYAGTKNNLDKDPVQFRVYVGDTAPE